MQTIKQYKGVNCQRPSRNKKQFLDKIELMTLTQLSIENKIENIKLLFAGRSSEEKIQALLRLGQSLSAFAEELKIPQNRVAGCQSILYISSYFENGKVFFNASADSFISAGLASLLLSVYSGESPQTILKIAPSFLNDIEIFATLTPSRSNGLAHIHQRIKNDAIKFLLSTANSMEHNSITS